jgi:hypothetical protein
VLPDLHYCCYCCYCCKCICVHCARIPVNSWQVIADIAVVLKRSTLLKKGFRSFGKSGR